VQEPRGSARPSIRLATLNVARERMFAPPAQTAADIRRCAFTGASSLKHLPLDGAEILPDALAGGTGTIKWAERMTTQTKVKPRRRRRQGSLRLPGSTGGLIF
jgi:hypothetical protein